MKQSLPLSRIVLALLFILNGALTVQWMRTTFLHPPSWGEIGAMSVDSVDSGPAPPEALQMYEATKAHLRQRNIRRAILVLFGFLPILFGLILLLRRRWLRNLFSKKRVISIRRLQLPGPLLLWIIVDLHFYLVVKRLKGQEPDPVLALVDYNVYARFLKNFGENVLIGLLPFALFLFCLFMVNRKGASNRG